MEQMPERAEQADHERTGAQQLYLVILCQVWGSVIAVGNHRSLLQIVLNLPELFQGGFEVVDDLGGDDIGGGEVRGILKGVVLQPEDVEVPRCRGAAGSSRKGA